MHRRERDRAERRPWHLYSAFLLEERLCRHIARELKMGRSLGLRGGQTRINVGATTSSSCGFWDWCECCWLLCMGRRFFSATPALTRIPDCYLFLGCFLDQWATVVLGSQEGLLFLTAGFLLGVGGSPQHCHWIAGSTLDSLVAIHYFCCLAH